MKLIEELKFGDVFCLNENNFFILTHDFRLRNKDKQYQAVNLKDGFYKWFPADTIVNNIGLYTTDKNNNIIAIKEYKDDYETFIENKNIS